jgi:hypothetical protein
MSAVERVVLAKLTLRHDAFNKRPHGAPIREERARRFGLHLRLTVHVADDDDGRLFAGSPSTGSQRDGSPKDGYQALRSEGAAAHDLTSSSS